MSSQTNSNERSWAIEVIKKVETYAQSKNYIIKKVGGEETISSGKKKMFPDVLLFADNDSSTILQGWELKMPDVPIDDAAFIKDAWRKAEILGLNSTFIWNFRYGVFYIKDATTNKFVEKHRWDMSATISKNRDDVKLHKALWEKELFDAVDKINDYLKTGKYREITIGEAISSNVIGKIINDNKSLVADHIKTTAKSNMILHSFLQVWWDEVNEEYIKDESEPSAAYAKVILLNWVTKFILAHLLRQKNSDADEQIVKIEETTTPKDALCIFEEITRKCDFYSIFTPLDYQETIPDATWQELLELHYFLLKNGTNILKQDDLQKVLENTTAVSNRLIIGQFTTPKKLAEFMVRSAITDIEKVCWDPCCGSGTIPKEAIKHKYAILSDYNRAYETTFASDKFAFPLQITNIGLTSSDTMNIPCRLFQKDVFDLKDSDIIEITNPANGDILRIPLNDISFIISNLPFIDFNKNNKHKENREAIAKRIIEDVRKNTGVELDNRSDYSFFIIFHLWNLLKTGGRACLITSNSWVGTDSGTRFIKALRYYYHIKSVFISTAEKWFKNADVVSTIFILEKKDIGEASDDAPTNYFKMNKKLDDMDDKDMNKAVHSSMMEKTIDPKVMTVQKHTIKEVEDVRKDFGCSYYAGFIDFAWLEDFKSKICPIANFFDCFVGMRSGNNNFFYDTETKNIDSDYYSPLLKDPKHCSSYICKPDMFVIDCDKSHDELIALGHIKTADYFEINESALKDVKKSRGDMWWKIPQIQNKAALFTPVNPNQRIFFGRLLEPCSIDQRFVGYYPLSEDIDVELSHALLNSIFSIFTIESRGFGRGLAVLDLNRTKLKSIKILNPDLLSDAAKKNIKEAFAKLCSRDIKKDLEDEINSKDRQEFDMVVLESFGLAKYYETIKQALFDLYRMRLSVKK